MGEDYTNLSKEELIEKLKSRDERINEMGSNYEKELSEMDNELQCMKKVFDEKTSQVISETNKQVTETLEDYNQIKEELENEKEKSKYNEIGQLKYSRELAGAKSENELLKNTIVAMAAYTYPGIANFDKIFRNIEHNLEMIRKGK